MEGGEFPPPASYVIEPRDLAAVRARQIRNVRAKGGSSNLLGLACGALCGVALLGLSAAAADRFAAPVWELFVFALVSFGLGVFVWTGVNQWLMGRALRRLDERVASSSAGGAATARLDEAGFEIASAAGVGTRCAYSGIAAVERDAEGLFLYLGDDLILFVPARAFPDEAAAARWAETIEGRRTPS